MFKQNRKKQKMLFRFLDVIVKGHFFPHSISKSSSRICYFLYWKSDRNAQTLAELVVLQGTTHKLCQHSFGLFDLFLTIILFFCRPNDCCKNCQSLNKGANSITAL